VRALVIDPSPELAEADARLLTSIERSMQIEAISDLATARQRTQRPADVGFVVFAIRNGPFRCYSLIETLCHWAIGVPVVVLSLSDSPEEMLEVRRCGAAGYVPLNLRRDVLANVLRVLLMGGEYFPVWRYLRDLGEALDIVSSRSAEQVFGQLTPRQREVLEHLAQGLSNKQIALALRMSSGTTRTHVAAVLRVLGVRTRLQATKLYFEAAQKH
jgi:DNA-binding NarL/FixJ family response regulator